MPEIILQWQDYRGKLVYMSKKIIVSVPTASTMPDIMEFRYEWIRMLECSFEADYNMAQSKKKANCPAFFKQLNPK